MSEKYGDDYWSIDKRMERAARPDHFQKLPYNDFRLNFTDCERLNKALRLLREWETAKNHARQRGEGGRKSEVKS